MAGTAVPVANERPRGIPNSGCGLSLCCDLLPSPGYSIVGLGATTVACGAERSQGSMLVSEHLHNWLIGMLQTSMILMFSSRRVKGGYKWLHPLTSHHPLSSLNVNH